MIVVAELFFSDDLVMIRIGMKVLLRFARARRQSQTRLGRLRPSQGETDGLNCARPEFCYMSNYTHQEKEEKKAVSTAPCHGDGDCPPASRGRLIFEDYIIIPPRPSFV